MEKFPATKSIVAIAALERKKRELSEILAEYELIMPASAVQHLKEARGHLGAAAYDVEMAI